MSAASIVSTTTSGKSRGPVQRHVLYLGEINDFQLASWEKAITVFDERDSSERPLALYPDDRPLPDHAREYSASPSRSTAQSSGDGIDDFGDQAKD